MNAEVSKKLKVTNYNDDGQLYFVSYEDGDKKTLIYRQVRQYKCLDQDKETMQIITRLSTQLHQANLIKKMTISTTWKLQHTLKTQYTMIIQDKC